MCMDEQGERGLAALQRKVGFRPSPAGGRTEFVGCEAMNIPQTGLLKRDMLI